EISTAYDPAYQQLQFHYVKIYRNGKFIDKLDPKKVKLIQRETSRERFIYDGAYTAILTLEDVREGDIIDYAYSIQGQNPIFKGKFATSFSLQFHDPLDKLFTRILLPAGRNLAVKTYGNNIDPAIKTAPVTKQEGAFKTYSWNLVNVPGLTSDDNVPYWYEPYPFIWASEYKSCK
ncbi:MAG: DUF3857 domain-containing protein, partial [Hymenobacteraceae bacterium]|nr:DUF3857 domain-containing protein [Hymenobacteraceae bacterium]MDX5397645.1 DUF3857 domain-containing protein [Hymenobacteraceae bacterium]MDX5513723.1 DUF3857 domain-containing protein [Hymenobacteraceae bacterium]